jgi:hypothetical protein
MFLSPINGLNNHRHRGSINISCLTALKTLTRSAAISKSFVCPGRACLQTRRLLHHFGIRIVRGYFLFQRARQHH